MPRHPPTEHLDRWSAWNGLPFRLPFRLATVAITSVLAVAMPSMAADDASAADAYFLIDAATLPVTLPYEDVASHVVVDIGIGNDEPVPFMLDTGAPTFISQAIRDKHAGAVIEQFRSEAGGGAIITSDLVVLPAMDVGGVSIIDSLVLSPWLADGPLYCVSPNGLLGANALQPAVWQIDYGDQRVTAAASVDQLEHIEGAIELAFTSQAGHAPTPFVRLRVGTGELDFIVDTGGGIPIVIDPAALASVGIDIPADAPRSVHLASGAGGTFETEVAFVDLSLALGESELVTTVGVGEGFAPRADGTIGHDFLKNFVVTFDWSTQSLYLDPLADGIAPLREPPAAGLGWRDGQVIVSAVAVGGSADVAGLSLGEVVTGVDGASTEGIGLDDFCDLVNTGSHTTLTTATGVYSMRPVEGFYVRLAASP